tara:strand:- start:25139 stop:25468 length:330 start_codon:yes stop_codon:yes gene_type:complete
VQIGEAIASSIFAIRNKGVSMQCKHHPNALLEHQEITYKDNSIYGGLSDSYGNSITKDVLYCPECFTEHEAGQIMKHNIRKREQSIITLDEINNKIDCYIENQIDRRIQ